MSFPGRRGITNVIHVAVPDSDGFQPRVTGRMPARERAQTAPAAIASFAAGVNHATAANSNCTSSCTIGTLGNNNLATDSFGDVLAVVTLRTGASFCGQAIVLVAVDWSVPPWSHPPARLSPWNRHRPCEQPIYRGRILHPEVSLRFDDPNLGCIVRQAPPANGPTGVARPPSTISERKRSHGELPLTQPQARRVLWSGPPRPVPLPAAALSTSRLLGPGLLRLPERQRRSSRAWREHRFRLLKTRLLATSISSRMVQVPWRELTRYPPGKPG